MKQQDVVLGEVYAVKVSGSIQPVRLETVSPHGGWVGATCGPAARSASARRPSCAAP